MQRPPRHPEQPIMTGQLVFRTVLVGVLLSAGASACLSGNYYTRKCGQGPHRGG